MTERGPATDNTAQGQAQVGIQAGHVSDSTVNVTRTEHHYHVSHPYTAEALDRLGAENGGEPVAGTVPSRRSFSDGTLRLSWDTADGSKLILETDDFNISFGRNVNNRVHLPDHRDGRFHGHLALVGAALVYQHLGRHPAYLIGVTRQVRVAEGESCPVGDKDRLRFASGTVLVECSVPDLYDPNATSTSSADEGSALEWKQT